MKCNKLLLRHLHLFLAQIQQLANKSLRSYSHLRVLVIPMTLNIYIYIYIWIPHFFEFKNAHTPLYLSKDKTKEQSFKNEILTLTKTLPKKYDKFRVNCQIALSIYKLNC